MKCRLALDSIAQRYPRGAPASAMPEHVGDVGRERRIGVDIVLELACGDAEFHREAEHIDQLLTGVSDEMRAENFVRRLVDNAAEDHHVKFLDAHWILPSRCRCYFDVMVEVIEPTTMVA